MSSPTTYQEKLAVEFISPNLCSGCRFYIYNSENQICLFHSSPIEDCNIVNLDINGELRGNRYRGKIKS